MEKLFTIIFLFLCSCVSQDEEPDATPLSLASNMAPAFWCDGDGVCFEEESLCSIECFPSYAAYCYRHVQKDEQVQAQCFSTLEGCVENRQTIFEWAGTNTLRVEGCVRDSGSFSSSSDGGSVQSFMGIEEYRLLVKEACLCDSLECLEKLGATQERFDRYGGVATEETILLSRELVACVNQVKSTTPWSYSEVTNPKEGSRILSATTINENQNSFDYPPSGGVEANLILIKNPNEGQAVVLTLPKEQLVCHSNSRCRVSVRFDGGASGVSVFRGIEDSEGHTNRVFLEPATVFIKKIGKAKKVVVELELYKKGRKAFLFSVVGLRW